MISSVTLKVNCVVQFITSAELKQTILMGKPEISDEQSKQFSRHSVQEASENMGCVLRRCNFFYPFQSFLLILINFLAGRSSTTSNSLVLCLCTRFPSGWKFQFAFRSI